MTEVLQLQTIWNELCEKSEHRNVFMTFGWYRSWIEDSQVTPYLLISSRDGVVTGICPLVLRHIHRFGLSLRKLEFLGPHTDYNDLIAGNDAVCQFAAILDHLRTSSNEWDLLDLREIRDLGSHMSELHATLQNSGLHYRLARETAACPYLPITGNSKELMKALSVDRQRSLQKKIRHMEDHKYSIDIIESPNECQMLLDDMIALDHKKAAQSRIPLVAGANSKTFRSLFNELGPAGWLYVATLRTNETLVAFELGFRCDDKLWMYNKAYDREYSQYSPGAILLSSVLDYGYAKGFKEYDFLRGEEPYKLLWTNQLHKQLRIVIWNHNWRSRISASLYTNLRLKGMLN